MNKRSNHPRSDLLLTLLFGGAKDARTARNDFAALLSAGRLLPAEAALAPLVYAGMQRAGGSFPCENELLAASERSRHHNERLKKFFKQLEHTLALPFSLAGDAVLLTYPHALAESRPIQEVVLLVPKHFGPQLVERCKSLPEFSGFTQEPRGCRFEHADFRGVQWLCLEGEVDERAPGWDAAALKSSLLQTIAFRTSGLGQRVNLAMLLDHECASEAVKEIARDGSKEGLLLLRMFQRLCDSGVMVKATESFRGVAAQAFRHVHGCGLRGSLRIFEFKLARLLKKRPHTYLFRPRAFFRARIPERVVLLFGEWHCVRNVSREYLETGAPQVIVDDDYVAARVKEEFPNVEVIANLQKPFGLTTLPSLLPISVAADCVIISRRLSRVKTLYEAYPIITFPAFCLRAALGKKQRILVSPASPEKPGYAADFTLDPAIVLRKNVRLFLIAFGAVILLWSLLAPGVLAFFACAFLCVERLFAFAAKRERRLHLDAESPGRDVSWAKVATCTNGHREITVREELPALGVQRTWHYTLLRNGERRCARDAISAGQRVVVTGCSWTFGIGLDDEATLCWHLQEQLPQAEIRNLAKPGASPYQNLVDLRQFLASQRVDVVVFGFTPALAWRNTPHASVIEWYRGPQCKPVFRNGRLVPVEAAAIRYTRFPFVTASHIMEYLETRCNAARALLRSRPSAVRRAMEAVFCEMKRTCDEHGAKFLVAFLCPAQSWEQILSQQDISCVDTGVDIYEKSEHGSLEWSQPPFDTTHPGAAAHGRYASALAPAIRLHLAGTEPLVRNGNEIQVRDSRAGQYDFYPLF